MSTLAWLVVSRLGAALVALYFLSTAAVAQTSGPSPTPTIRVPAPDTGGDFDRTASARQPDNPTGGDEAAADKEKTDATEALAKQAQNPIANLISLPFQNNTTFDYGPRHGTQNILNIQPVLPFTLSEDWNLITRWVLPIVHQPSFARGDSSDTGTGNLNPTLFLSTSLAEDFLVGFGPTFLLPTASSNELGTKKWGVGPSAVVVWTPGHWLVGTLVNNIWSFAGPDNRQSKVNQFLVQPFVNYNLSDGWYLTSAPIVTADWEDDRSADTWTVPVGGGFGKLFHLDPLPPINVQVEAFRLAEAPRHGGTWTLRTQLQFLFPK